MLVRIIFFSLLPLLLMAGCDTSDPSVIQREQILMGTRVSISVSGADPDTANPAIDLAFQEIRRVEKIMSSYLPESELSLINRSAGERWVTVDPELLHVIQEALAYSRLSDGAFDITFKPLSRLWSFEPESRPPDVEAIREVLPLVDYRAILIDDRGRVMLKNRGMGIGLGGIAKGYAVDRAAMLLQEQGIKNAIINAGGDLRVIGRRSPHKPWRIGVRDPGDQDGVMRLVSLAKGALATSGDYERFFIYEGSRYHHILSPKTGFPARGCRSATILCPTVMMADALATAVFVLGPDKGMELIRRLPNVEGMIVTEDDAMITSEGFPKEEKKWAKK